MIGKSLGSAQKNILRGFNVILFVDEADAKPQDCFAITDWNMLWDSSDDIEEYTTSVTGFINKCI